MANATSHITCSSVTKIVQYLHGIIMSVSFFFFLYQYYLLQSDIHLIYFLKYKWYSRRTRRRVSVGEKTGWCLTFGKVYRIKVFLYQNMINTAGYWYSTTVYMIVR